ncbi:carboxylate-amine ligase [Actinoallomurus iriomotensis]|nr:glutamate--cysteine ligase [Actinoallomurus iriomotensis]
MDRNGRTMGVEEEFLLVDAVTRRTSPHAPAVLARAAKAALPEVMFQAELVATQVEAATGVCRDLETLRRQLADARTCLAAAARAEGVRLVSTGNPVLPGRTAPFMPGEHYARIADILAGTVVGHETCGCHVHIGVPDRELAVGVLNHLRPWLPTLVALSVNSPFDHGRDSGYGSWRIQVQARFPGGGVPPWFASAAAYDEFLDRMVELGVLADRTTTFWLARPSPRLPTIEVRASDAAATVDEAVLQAAVVRALVVTALGELAGGREAAPVGEQLCTVALWSAARYGLTGQGIHLLEERRTAARDLLDELLRRIRPALEETGDLRTVRALVRKIGHSGTGAARQRIAAVHGLRSVVDMLIQQTGRR